MTVKRTVVFFILLCGLFGSAGEPVPAETSGAARFGMKRLDSINDTRLELFVKEQKLNGSYRKLYFRIAGILLASLNKECRIGVSPVSPI